MLLNSYPESFNNRHIKNAVFSNLNSNNNNNSRYLNNENSNIDFTKPFILPELGLYTEKIKHTLYNNLQINTIFRYAFKLKSIIKLQIDILENKNRKNLVDQIYCKNCSKNYDGQTKRLLNSNLQTLTRKLRSSNGLGKNKNSACRKK